MPLLLVYGIRSHIFAYTPLFILNMRSYHPVYHYSQSLSQNFCTPCYTQNRLIEAHSTTEQPKHLPLFRTTPRYFHLSAQSMAMPLRVSWKLVFLCFPKHMFFVFLDLRHMSQLLKQEPQISSRRCNPLIEGAITAMSSA